MVKRPASASTLSQTAQRLLRDAVALHRSGRIKDAAKQYKLLLKERDLPNQALNLAAVAFSGSGDSKAAEQTLMRAIKQDGNDVEALGNMGRILEQSGNHKRSREMFRRALKLRGTDTALHYGLGCAEASLGNLNAAADAFGESLKISPENLRAANNLGNAFIALGRLEDAKGAYLQALEVNPDYVEAWFNLGNVERELDRPDRAADAFIRALTKDPGHARAFANLGSTTFEMGKYAEAEAQLRQALTLDPEMAEAWNNLGNTLEKLGRYEEAVTALERAVALKPDFAEPISNLGIVNDRLDDIEAAKSLYETAIGMDPKNPHLHANLANLFEKRNMLEETRGVLNNCIDLVSSDPELALVAAKCDRRGSNLQASVQKLLAIRDAPMRKHVRAQIEMELGRSYDRIGETAAAFQCFTKGNDLSEEVLRYGAWDKGYFRSKVRNLTLAATPDNLGFLKDQGPAARNNSPIFLIGFPRSGTTLLDVILDGHSQIVTMEEKPATATMETYVAAAPGEPGAYEPDLQKLTASDLEQLRKIYRTEAAKHCSVAPGQRLIDKFPLNIIQIPLILRAFPDAQFILALRHPCDVVLSCFMQAFEPNPAIANFFNLTDAAATYDAVMGLWLRYEELMSPRVHRVRYEDLVDGPEQAARGVIEFLGLDWEEKVLDHVAHAESRGRINTPSYHQVSEPIYSRARGRWRRYEEHLAPELPLLAPYIEAFGYSLANDGS